MGVTIYLYKMKKRFNSTKSPTQETPERVYQNCEIKGGCSMLSPTIIIRDGFSGFTNHPGEDYNYCFIQQFQRFYWITDWLWQNGLWSITTSVDVLATYKTELLNQSLYVLRSASAVDSTIVDNKYPVTAVQGVISNIATTRFFDYQYQNGTYVVGIINSDSSAVGSVSYYAFTASQFQALKDYLMRNVNDYMDADTIVGALEGMTESLLKFMLNPYEYIASINWFPFTIPAAQLTALTSFTFGWWTIQLPCSRITNFQVIHTDTLNIPKHPDAVTRSALYLYNEPYSVYTLTFPPFGCMQIPSANLIDALTLTISVATDLTTGKACLWVGTGDIQILTCVQQLAVPIQISNVTTQTSVAAIAANTAGGLMGRFSSEIAHGVEDAGAWIMNNIIGVNYKQQYEASRITANTISDGLEAISSVCKSTGGNGTVADYYFFPRLQLNYNKLAEEDNDQFGRPLCKVKKLSTLTGYCQCADADLNIQSINVTELAMLASFVTGGFFIE